jgi:hypothetical protein
VVSLDVVLEAVRIFVKLLSSRVYEVAVQATDEADVVLVVVDLVAFISQFLMTKTLRAKVSMIMPKMTFKNMMLIKKKMEVS